jgi:hypothetical protein
MGKLTAKEYYYEVIAPEDDGKSYQALSPVDHFAMHSRLRQELGDEKVEMLAKALARWKPRYSNDILLDELVEELISIQTEPLRSRLEKVFVAKRNTKIANAGALSHSEEFDGDIVVFYVGLSDAAYQYSILFREFTLVKQRVRERDYAAPRRFHDLALMVGLAQMRWRDLGGYIQLSLDDVMPPTLEQDGKAADIAVCTDRFILGHEIAHHLLGHTSESRMALRGLRNNQVPQPPEWDDFPPTWTRELQADSSAIGLFLGTHDTSVEEMYTTVALGALLTITVLGQLADDVETGTETHPPLRLRYENALNTLSIVPNPHLGAISKDIQNFQRLLFKIQRRGLGSNNI